MSAARVITVNDWKQKLIITNGMQNIRKILYSEKISTKIKKGVFLEKAYFILYYYDSKLF